MNTSTIPIYVAECSAAKHRGRSVAIQLSIVIVSLSTRGVGYTLMSFEFGLTLAYWIDYGTIKNLTGEVSRHQSLVVSRSTDRLLGGVEISNRFPKCFCAHNARYTSVSPGDS